MADLKKIAIKLGTDGPVKTLATPRKVQILHGGVYIVRSTNAVYVWEHPYFPQLYIPTSELRASSEQGGFDLHAGEEIKTDAGKHVATQYTVTVPGRDDKSTSQIIAFHDSNLEGSAAALQGLTKINFDAVDQWFEEDTPIHVHPKDPFKRVDVLQSQRRIVVKVDGHTLADTSTSMHLYETGLPCRFYLPLTAVDAAVLRPSTTRTKCPYKGEAEYYSVEVGGKLHEDLFWYYTRPTLECGKVEGLLCPYNERVDIELDGELLPRPKTLFGKPKENKKPPIL